MVLPNEIGVVWVEDISDLDYVRELITDASTRQRPIPWHGEGRRVGYTVLAKDAPNIGYSGFFRRRLFFLKPHDRDSDPDGVYSKGMPSEAVDPSTIQLDLFRGPPVAIYVLIDPRTKEKRYVGRSKNPEQRLRQHVRKWGFDPMGRWIIGLCRRKLEPEVLILEWASPTEFKEREKFWIQKGFEQGWPLLNKVGQPK